VLQRFEAVRLRETPSGREERFAVFVELRGDHALPSPVADLHHDPVTSSRLGDVHRGEESARNQCGEVPESARRRRGESPETRLASSHAQADDDQMHIAVSDVKSVRDSPNAVTSCPAAIPVRTSRAAFPSNPHLPERVT
jgi:hypothetical protein